MPDIKTALSTVLNQWEQDENKQITQQQEKPMGKQLFKTTNNVSRETFNFIKTNPNKTTAEVANALEKRGFKESSVTSICAQMSKQGMVTKDMYTKRLVALVPEYVPLKTASAFKSGKPALKAVKQAPQNAGIASIAPQDKPELKVPTSIVLTRNWHPHDIVNKLSVMQARELYDLLKEIFKG
jgi:excinuclease UvrABC ATPase subunit